MPLIEIKQKNAALEYAVFLCEYFRNRFGYQVDESEVAILAQILKYALFQTESGQEKQRVCLVFKRGKNNTLNYTNWLKRNFQAFIAKIEAVEFYELEEKKVTEYDVIISDMPKYRLSTSLPIFQTKVICDQREKREIIHLLTGRERKLGQFLNIFQENLYFTGVNANTREEVIELLCGKIERRSIVDEGLSAMVKKREDASSTERGNNMAIAVSYLPCANQTSCAVAVLRRPILWDRELVQIVFLIVEGRDEMRFQFGAWLQKLSRNMNFIHGILKAQAYGEVIGVLSKAFMQEEKI